MLAVSTGPAEGAVLTLSETLKICATLLASHCSYGTLGFGGAATLAGGAACTGGGVELIGRFPSATLLGTVAADAGGVGRGVCDRSAVPVAVAVD